MLMAGVAMLIGIDSKKLASMKLRTPSRSSQSEKQVLCLKSA